MSDNSGDDLIVDWWWTPDCGAIHTERNPVVIEWHCNGWGTDSASGSIGEAGEHCCPPHTTEGCRDDCDGMCECC